MNDKLAESLAGHLKRNQELADLIRKKGASLDEPRLIECHFWASSRLSADQMATALEARGFQRLIVSDTGRNLWNVEMTVIESVNRVVGGEFTSGLIEVAAMFDGKFDGWGTSI